MLPAVSEAPVDAEPVDVAVPALFAVALELAFAAAGAAVPVFLVAADAVVAPALFAVVPELAFAAAGA
ncbi:MAG TPA: hypothetical protein VEK14_04495, partial [Rhodomicrobium sp.]|nr:hypothetical protein [Rhodomicrobium sp.]